uniref:Envelope glycoprotein n=1 Tax=Parastrongyloides trichosuri TaxID=131310 RepID=A0A0N4ZCU4_PARTI
IIVFFLVDEFAESKTCYQYNVYADWQLTFKCNSGNFNVSSIYLENCYLGGWFRYTNCWPWINITNVSTPTHHFEDRGSAAWGNGFFTKVTIQHNCSTSGSKCSFWPPEPTYSCKDTIIPKWGAEVTLTDSRSGECSFKSTRYQI